MIKMSRLKGLNIDVFQDVYLCIYEFVHVNQGMEKNEKTVEDRENNVEGRRTQRKEQGRKGLNIEEITKKEGADRGKNGEGSMIQRKEQRRKVY